MNLELLRSADASHGTRTHRRPHEQTVEQVLDNYLADKGLSRSDTWFYFLIGSARIPYFPIAPLRRFLVIHDLHHIVTGYSTSLHHEVYLIGWELMSGGWGRHNWWYFGKSINILWMLIVSPVGMWTALRNGSRCRNLHRYEVEELLSMEYADVVALVKQTPQPALSGEESTAAGSQRRDLG